MSVCFLFYVALAALCCPNVLGNAVDCPITAPEYKLGPSGEGSILNVTFTASVGVTIDDIPPEDRKNVSKFLMSRPDSWWEARAKQQIHFSDYVFTYYGQNTPPWHDSTGANGNKDSEYRKNGQLPLPLDQFWNIMFNGPAVNGTWRPKNSDKPHLAVYRSYSFYTIVVTDYASPARSSPQLGKVGGWTTVAMYLPLDPANTFARIGTACNDDWLYPILTGDPFLPQGLYDWFTAGDHSATKFQEEHCKPADSNEISCSWYHCGPDDVPRSQWCPELDCPEAVAEYIGLVETPILWSRLPYTRVLADQYRHLPYDMQPVPGSDILPWLADLEQNAIAYKYFAADAVELEEETIPSVGWHQLHHYSSTNYNLGLEPLYIGPQAKRFFVGDDNEAKCAFHGLFEFNEGHGHCHLEPYNLNQYTINGQSAMDNSKRGFCIISVSRLRNDETTPMQSNFDSCGNQGMSPGWGDLYQLGITGQAKIVTGLPEGWATYTITENAWNAICEGHLQCDAADPTKILFEHNLYLSDLYDRPVETWVCRHDPSHPAPLDNNVATKQMYHHGAGKGYVTSPSSWGEAQEIGPFKDAEYELMLGSDGQQVRQCTVGTTVTVTCTLPVRATELSDSQVIRICEGSYQLRNTGGADTANGVAIPCRYMTVGNQKEELAHVTVTGLTRTASVTFPCPAGRGLSTPTSRAYEAGGLFGLYRAMLVTTNGGPTPTVTCTVSAPAA